MGARYQRVFMPEMGNTVVTLTYKDIKRLFNNNLCAYVLSAHTLRNWNITRLAWHVHTEPKGVSVSCESFAHTFLFSHSMWDMSLVNEWGYIRPLLEQRTFCMVLRSFPSRAPVCSPGGAFFLYFERLVLVLHWLFRRAFKTNFF